MGGPEGHLGVRIQLQARPTGEQQPRPALRVFAHARALPLGSRVSRHLPASVVLHPRRLTPSSTLPLTPPAVTDAERVPRQWLARRTNTRRRRRTRPPTATAALRAGPAGRAARTPPGRQGPGRARRRQRPDVAVERHAGGAQRAVRHSDRLPVDGVVDDLVLGYGGTLGGRGQQHPR